MILFEKLEKQYILSYYFKQNLNYDDLGVNVIMTVFPFPRFDGNPTLSFPPL